MLFLTSMAVIPRVLFICKIKRNDGHLSETLYTHR